MTEIVDFLLARLDEDEALAKAVWPLGHTTDLGGNRLDEIFSIGRAVPSSEDGSYRLVGDIPASEHFLSHDPARVLANVAAKRKIVDVAAESVALKDLSYYEDHSGERELAAFVLRQLAQPYADHPAFDPAWRV